MSSIADAPPHVPADNSWGRRLLNHPRFELLLNALIALNAMIIGAQTYSVSLLAWQAKSGVPAMELLQWGDNIILGIFCAELLLKVSLLRRDFFRDRWNLFDATTILASLLAQNPVFAAIRVLRVLRVVRLLSRFKVLKLMTTVMIKSIAGCFWISLLTLIVIFLYAIVGCELYGASSPEMFGNLHRAMNTMFRIAMLISYDDVIQPLADKHPSISWFVIPYMLIMYLGFLNFFSAIILYLLYEVSFEELQTGEIQKADESNDELLKAAGLPTEHLTTVLEELRQMRLEISAMKGEKP